MVLDQIQWKKIYLSSERFRTVFNFHRIRRKNLLKMDLTGMIRENIRKKEEN